LYHFDFEETDRASRSVINAIRSAAPASGMNQGTKDAMDVHLKFSKCETISEIDQQQALVELERVAEDGGGFDAALLEVVPTKSESVN